ncbi:MAG: ATP-binding protein [Actinomycetes bacterium]
MTEIRAIGRWTLAGHLPSAAQARALVRDALPAHGRLEDIELVASELVANAVEHGEGDVELALALRPPGLRLTVVSGAAAGEPQVRPASPEDEGGRGLAIVAALADRWGWDQDDGRLAVWAEFEDGWRTGRGRVEDG